MEVQTEKSPKPESEWTHSGKLDDGTEFRFSPKNGTEREVKFDGKVFKMYDGVFAVKTDSPGWATMTQGVLTEELPRGESLSTNSPELAQAFLGGETAQTAQAEQAIDFDSFLKKGASAPSNPWSIPLAIGAVAVGAMILRRRQQSE